jgi:hypothetical protein
MVLRPAPASAVAILLTWFAFASPGVAEDKSYVLRFKELESGVVASYTVDRKVETFIQEINAQNITTFTLKYKLDSKLAFWARYEGKGRYRRGYGEARATMDGVKEVLPLEGKRVAIDWNDKGFTFKIDGVKDIPERFQNILDYECQEEFTVGSCLREAPVKLKETWKYDAGAEAKWFQQHSTSLDYDLKNVQGLARLEEVYEKDGRRFGKIVQHFELPVLVLKVDGKRKKLNTKDKHVIQIHHDCCIDGSAHLGSHKVVDYLSTTTKESEEGVNYTLKVVSKNERNVSFSEGVKKK